MKKSDEAKRAKVNETIKRYILLIIGLFFSALGIAVTKHGGLGVSPISSIANVMSLKFSDISVGNWLIVCNLIMIVCQILILRKNFRLIQLLQIPLTFLFGYFTDFGSWMISFIPANNYFIRLILAVVGTVILGFGITLSVSADKIMNSGEAFVKAIADTTKCEFGNVKICTDISCVIISILLSLIFFDFTIVGTREGTLIAAIFTGVSVKFFTKLLREKILKLIK